MKQQQHKQEVSKFDQAVALTKYFFVCVGYALKFLWEAFLEMRAWNKKHIQPTADRIASNATHTAMDTFQSFGVYDDEKSKRDFYYYYDD